MRVTLEPHPDSLAPPLRIAAEAERGPQGLFRVSYRVTGEIGELLLPPPAPPRRAVELWRHTCFEAFLRAPDEAGYIELNFAPSGEWAVYRFSDYRIRMANPDSMPLPEMEARLDGSAYELAASVLLEPALGLLAEAPWQLALTAVIETRDGSRSYWSAKHAPGDPDFHHRDCFALELPPPPPT